MANPEHLKILKKGFKEWNNWRENNPTQFPDLKGASLIKADIRLTNLRYANLANANLTSAILRGADLTQADLTNADLTQADLTNANLTSSNLRDAILIYAHLNNILFSSINQLEMVSTLFGSKFDFDLSKKIKKECPELLEHPSALFNNKIRYRELPKTKPIKRKYIIRQLSQSSQKPHQPSQKISVLFEGETMEPEKITNFLIGISELYRAIGGDRLLILNSGVRETILEEDLLNV